MDLQIYHFPTIAIFSFVLLFYSYQVLITLLSLLYLIFKDLPPLFCPQALPFSALCSTCCLLETISLQALQHLHSRVCIFFALFSLSIPFPQKYNDPIDQFLLLKRIVFFLLIFLLFNWNESHTRHENNFGTEKDDRQQTSCAHIFASLLVLQVLILWNGWPWLASADLTYGRTHFLFSSLSFAYFLKSYTCLFSRKIVLN